MRKVGVEEYTIKIKINQEVIDEIIESALGSYGIDHWCDDVVQYKTHIKIKNSEDELWYILTIKKLLVGLEIALANERWINLDDLDGPACDVIVQYALFGKYVYA